jgi:hypothetical protein
MPVQALLRAAVLVVAVERERGLPPKVGTCTCNVMWSNVITGLPTWLRYGIFLPIWLVALGQQLRTKDGEVYERGGPQQKSQIEMGPNVA